MNNYIKCKYPINISSEVCDKLDANLTEITFLCKSINKKHGEFRIGSRGELFHNIIEYEKVDESEIGSPGVIWNGTGYAKVKNTDWEKLDYTGKLLIETHLIGKKTDASLKIDFEFANGNVMSVKPNILLIDNSTRLEHDAKLKKLSIIRVKRMNTWYYKLFKNLMINPLINICIYLRYPLIVCQDGLVKLEKKLKKIL